MTQRRGVVRAVAVGVVVVVADQLTKVIVRSSIERGDAVPVLPGVELVNTRNRGIAFGLFSEAGVLLVVLALAAMAVLVGIFVAHAGTPLAWLPTGLLLGGATGNLIDRVREGAVTDFISLPAWPAFNVADSAITVGVLALLYVLEGPPRRRREADG